MAPLNKSSFVMMAISIIVLGMVFQSKSDGQRDFGEACSLRSQVANFFRTQDSPEGCISAKGLICMSHKCVCSPTSVYETPTASSTDSASDSSLTATGLSYLKKLVRGGSSDSTSSTSNPIVPPATGGGVTGGRCAGRAGSPCINANSTCVQHASCHGSPVSLCSCQGIYSNNGSGFCSKSATVATQAFKGITSIISGK